MVVGESVGAFVGLSVGSEVGNFVGPNPRQAQTVGALVGGLVVGLVVGTFVGFVVGELVTGPGVGALLVDVQRPAPHTHLQFIASHSLFLVAREHEESWHDWSLRVASFPKIFLGPASGKGTEAVAGVGAQPHSLALQHWMLAS